MLVEISKTVDWIKQNKGAKLKVQALENSNIKNRIPFTWMYYFIDIWCSTHTLFFYSHHKNQQIRTS
jgi:hypothetical protein